MQLLGINITRFKKYYRKADGGGGLEAVETSL